MVKSLRGVGWRWLCRGSDVMGGGDSRLQAEKGPGTRLLGSGKFPEIWGGDWGDWERPVQVGKGLPFEHKRGPQEHWPFLSQLSHQMGCGR